MKKTNIFGLVLILSTLLIGCAQPNTSADIPKVYTITAAETTNGTISLSKTSAAAGETVTITATPASSWYELDTIAVSDSNGAVTVNNNSFTMPAGNVTVTVAFKEREFGDERANINVEFYSRSSSNPNNPINVTIYNGEEEVVSRKWSDIFPGKTKKSDFNNLELYKDTADHYYLENDNSSNRTLLRFSSCELNNNQLKIIFQ